MPAAGVRRVARLRRARRITGGALAGAALLVGALGLGACGTPATPTPAHHPTTVPGRPTTTTPPTTAAPTTAPPTTSPPTTTPAPATTTTVPPAAPPPVPATGAYLGAWVHPATAAGTPHSAFAVQLQTLPSFQQSIGRPLAILHIYSGWTAPAPASSLSDVASQGAIPLLDWGCGVPDATVAAGAADTLIRNYAEAIKAYGGPVFLRWFWEMNLPDTHPQCQSAGGAADFVAAWQHIVTIFRQVGASNVAFVWCPALSGSGPAPWYPGDAYVNWIGIDGYDRKGLGQTGFNALFASFYARWSRHGKPMMVAETGARPAVQAAYLQGAATAMAAMPLFKALVYFDATGPAASWELSSTGVAAFAALAQSGYFSPTAQRP